MNDNEKWLREALEDMITAFAEGVVWNDEQRAAYEKAAKLLDAQQSESAGGDAK